MIAFIYGSVGHGGASGYLAILALTGYFAPELVPVVLTLNIIVSTVALTNYSREGFFVWKLFWPFAIASIPAAFVGGYISLEADLFFITVGLGLILMAIAILIKTVIIDSEREIRPVNLSIAIIFGAGIGLLSGLIGVGGGIFLSPLILLLGWGTIRQIAAVTALFVLMNSLSGLTGHLFSTAINWTAIGLFALPVLAGGYFGSKFGVKTTRPNIIRYLLALVLVIAGIKMLAQYAF